MSVEPHKTSPALRRAGRMIGSTGATVLRYRSSHDGVAMVAVCLFHGNEGIGAMAQVFFIRADGEVYGEAQRSSCLTCALQPHLGGDCFVPPNGVGSVSRKVKADGYPDLPLPAFVAWANANNVKVRIGAWGDVASLPAGHPGLMWFGKVRSRACYTHAWKTRPDLWGLAMASCDSPRDRELARARGWGTFTAYDPDLVARPEGETCPKDEGSHCDACMGCSGDAAGDFVIKVHGYLASRKPATRSRAARRSLPML